MRFATFYTLSTGYVAGSIPPRFDGEKKPIPATGSDSVFILDGRLSLNNCANVARDICRKRSFIGFTIESGETFTCAHVIRKLELIADRESRA